MNFWQSSRVLLLGMLLVIALHSGCGRPKNVTVTGAVVRGGQPIPVSPTGVLQITLRPDVPPEVQYTPKVAECDRATGKFEVRDVPRGKYKIGIEQYDPNPQMDKLKGAFTADSSKIIREIDGKTPLNIDLAKPE